MHQFFAYDHLPYLLVFFSSIVIGVIPFNGFVPIASLRVGLNVLKGAVWIFSITQGSFMTPLGQWFGVVFEPGLFAQWTCGLLVVVGHCISPWLNQRPGKGIATAFGVLGVLSPIAALAGVVAYVATYWEKRNKALASIAGLLLATVVHVVLNKMDAYLWVGAMVVITILFRHEASINELLKDNGLSGN